MISSIILTVFTILTIYLRYYGYSSPDPAACWIIRGVNQASLSKAEAIKKAEDAGISIPAGYPVDMHKVFASWCIWGFWQNVTFVVLGALWIFTGS